MKRLIIGTAGHIDHGKTTLVKAMTGIDTDRLKEEKLRGISIELGFAPFVLPTGLKAAIVDMPGHEKFIRHMLAGAFGIDMVLLTIAADEGIMPQTREHLDIIELLQVKKGIIVLTKKDLVDEDWLSLVEEEVREYLQSSSLRAAPIIAVSAVTGENVPQLLTLIETLAEEIEEKIVGDKTRLPIDRVFTISGFGTVVTGTLWSGTIKIGDSLELMPVQKPVKVRTLNVHNEKVETAYAGQRVAVNLQGMELAEIKRGYWLSTPAFLNPSYRIDAKFRLLPSSARKLKNWTRVRFHLGTDETLGRIILLDRDELNPGEEAFVQIVLEKPAVAYKGDPIVVRSYSPATTIGGGRIIDPSPPKQKRFKDKTLTQLVIKEAGTLYDIIDNEMENQPSQIFTPDLLFRITGTKEENWQQVLEQLLEDEKIVDLTNDEYISTTGLNLAWAKINEILREYHQRYPLRWGYLKEDMRSRCFSSWSAKTFNAILKHLEEQNLLVVKNNELHLPQHCLNPGPKESQIIEQIMALMKSRMFNPPSLEELKQELKLDQGEFMEIWTYLLNQGQIIKISSDSFFSAVGVEKGRELLEAYFEQEKELSLATARDLWDTSRKYALPLMEYYDRMRITRRVGDVRLKN